MGVHKSPRAPKARATAAMHVRRDGRRDPMGVQKSPWVSTNPPFVCWRAEVGGCPQITAIWVAARASGSAAAPAFCLTRGRQPNETW
jgi:hypothetical protein